MCVSCGCGKPDDDHGDSRNITMADIDQAAEAAGTTRARVLQNITKGGQPDSSNSGQQQQQPVSVNSQSQAQQNTDAQSTAQPGTQPASQGQDSGTSWAQDHQNINYQPPKEQNHTN